MASEHATKRQTKKRAQARCVKNEKQHQISLCMIVKNEEEFLPGCLDSVKGVVDEIIIVDTGSTDRTVEIARQYGAKVYHYEWNDDFAAARNESLKHATCGWILVLDADERLASDAGPVLRKVARSAVPKTPYLCRIVNNHGDGTVTEHFYPRFFPNVPGTRYHGLVHEQLQVAGVEESGTAIRPSYVLRNFTVVHEGYRKDVICRRGKHQRNAHLLRTALSLREEPFYRYKLGATLFEESRPLEAIEELYKALEGIERLPAASRNTGLHAEVLFSLAFIFTRLRQYDKAMEMVDSGLKAYPDSQQLAYQKAVILFQLGDVKQAAKLFAAVARSAETQEFVLYKAMGFDPTIGSWKAQAMAARCCLVEGDVPGAIDWLSRVGNVLPGSVEWLTMLRGLLAEIGARKKDFHLDSHQQEQLAHLEAMLQQEAEALARRGDESLQKNEWEEAATRYRTCAALSITPIPTVMARLAFCLAKLGRVQEAFPIYLDALRACSGERLEAELLLELTRIFRSRIVGGGTHAEPGSLAG